MRRPDWLEIAVLIGTIVALCAFAYVVAVTLRTGF